jgi:hypothetical protein
VWIGCIKHEKEPTVDDFSHVFNPSKLCSILITGLIAAIALATSLCLAIGGERNITKPESVGPTTEAALRSQLKPNEKLVYDQHESLAGLNREIARTRILDLQTKSVSEVIQTANGPEPLDYLTLRQLNREALRTKFGAGGEGFDALMDKKPAVESLYTVQFVAGTDYARAAQEISDLGAKIDGRFRDLVSVKAFPSVAKKIARMATVDSVVSEHPKTVQALLMARDLAEAPLVPKHAAGFGRDLLAAIWEPNACINRIHPDFARVQWQPRIGDACDVKGGEIVFHSTMVANCFAAFRADGTAGLYQGRIFDVDDTNMQALDDMWSRKPNIVNASFTTSVFDGRRIDAEVYANRTSHVFTGVGNILTNGDGIACFGYNALCVGGYLNQNTIGGFQDDAIGPTSWQNQFRVEKPQVLGPYSGKMATSFFSGAPPNYESHGGSSFATPAVAGLAALLIANYPFDLTNQPEALRAVLMASAQAHPVISDGRTIPDFNDNIDDKMGVGAPNGIRAKHILDNHTLRYGSFLPRITGQPGLGLVTFTASRGDLVRVVLTWDQCPDYNVGDPQLSVDLDMVVEAPGGLPGPGNTTQLVTNFSQHDNWEVVEFRMARSGTVAIHVSAPVFRPCSLASNPQLVNYGLAWTKTGQAIFNK